MRSSVRLERVERARELDGGKDERTGRLGVVLPDRFAHVVPIAPVPPMAEPRHEALVGQTDLAIGIDANELLYEAVERSQRDRPKRFGQVALAQAQSTSPDRP